MLIKKLIIGLLSFYYAEIRRPKNDSGRYDISISVERIFEKKKKREKKQERTYNNRKWKKKKQYREKAFSLKGTRAKDVRYSNQQRLRRMYRNC